MPAYYFVTTFNAINQCIGHYGNMGYQISRGGYKIDCAIRIFGPFVHLFLQLQYIVKLLPFIFLGGRNNWYQSYNSTMIEIGAQKSQSGPIAWPKHKIRWYFTLKIDFQCQILALFHYLSVHRIQQYPLRMLIFGKKSIPPLKT